MVSAQKQKLLMCNGEKCLCAGYETDIIFSGYSEEESGVVVELMFGSSQLQVSTPIDRHSRTHSVEWFRITD